VAEPPAFVPKQHAHRDQRCDQHEGELEHPARRNRRNHCPRNHARGDGRRPGPDDLDRQIAFGAVRQERAQRGRNDDRERGADANLHPPLLRHSEHAEDFIEHGNDDRPAADPEQTGQQSGDETADDDRSRERGKLAERDTEH
jgi:hypothetical protein